ncbi:hypothetical protein TcG_01035 [Trypanosoma cruzi]|uniref:Paraflagellar rod component n=2 Tax=Trypanosoma cruzi TaxID=5693 RepID=V5BMX8_TRYCR|nr:hypothetical protein TCDM_13970 [Trypanosoma cruzi Dm28c]KAF8286247.1 hypothetical protein TcBrA4_0028120 [Trypanosoma cruzi]PBJ80902.1 hypothetical protein BCY84_01109 [Trypanosoma cruzi cruzi]PWU96684.1 hypothetical protein C4B63_18g1141c [Trypanosoma cruzi]RNF24224.1 hypothetical protein TcG_01035 [Trypanosoma cruzi]
MPNLCVSATFNPPVITILGSPLREETVKLLEQRIPTGVSTSSSPSKDPVKFLFYSNPDHWRMELSQHFCDDLHKSTVFLTIIEGLEGEGWNLRASNSIRDSESGKDTTKLFFARRD